MASFFVLFFGMKELHSYQLLRSVQRLAKDRIRRFTPAAVFVQCECAPNIMRLLDFLALVLCLGDVP